MSLDDYRLTDWKHSPQNRKLGKPIIAASWTAWVTHVDAIEGPILWPAWLKSSHRLSLHYPDCHPCFLNPSLDQTLQHIHQHKLGRKNFFFFFFDATACQTCDSCPKWTRCFIVKENAFHGVWPLNFSCEIDYIDSSIATITFRSY